MSFSSSMIRTFSLDIDFFQFLDDLPEWKAYRELAAVADFTFRRQAASVLADDAAAKRQPQARPAALGGVERPEDAIQVLGGNARPRVAHRDFQVARSASRLPAE